MKEDIELTVASGFEGYQPGDVVTSVSHQETCYYLVVTVQGTAMTLRPLTRLERAWRWLTAPLRRVYYWIWRRF